MRSSSFEIGDRDVDRRAPRRHGAVRRLARAPIVATACCAIALGLAASNASALVGINRVPAASRIIHSLKAHGVRLFALRGRFIPSDEQGLPPGATTAGCTPDTTFAPPPAGFNPVTAGRDQLLAYGFPPKPPGPENSAAVQGWEQAMQHAQIDAATAPASMSTPTSCGGPAWNDLYSGNWAGHVVQASYVNASAFTFSEAQWSFHGVPSSGDNNAGGQWTGTGDKYLIQSGTGEEASNPARYWFWHEDLPNLPKNEGPAVDGGDLIFVETDYLGNGNATYYEENESTNVFQPFTRPAPYDGSAAANFVYELHPSGTGLPNFSSIAVSLAAFGNNNTSWDLSTANDRVFMSSNCDISGTILASPTRVSNDAYSVNYDTSGPIFQTPYC